MHVCFIIKNDLSCFFHSVMSYGIIFRGNSSYSNMIFKMQKKRQSELQKDVRTEFCVGTYLRNYKFCHQHHNICCSACREFLFIYFILHAYCSYFVDGWVNIAVEQRKFRSPIMHVATALQLKLLKLLLDDCGKHCLGISVAWFCKQPQVFCLGGTIRKDRHESRRKVL